MIYRADTNEYFGRFHIRFFILVVALLMLITQLFVTIWWLTYHVWWWFFALAVIILANVAFAFSYKTRNPNIVIFIIIYQALFTVLLLAVVGNLIGSLCHPYNQSLYIFKHCAHNKKNNLNDCAKSVRIAGAVFFPIYLLFTVINAFCLVIIWHFYNYLRQEHAPSISPQRFNNTPPTYVPRSEQTQSTPVQQPPPPPATERIVEDPWDPRLPPSGVAPSYQNKPITPDWGTPAGYDPYRTQQFSSAPIQQYQSQNTGHLYDITPADDSW